MREFRVNKSEYGGSDSAYVRMADNEWDGQGLMLTIAREVAAALPRDRSVRVQVYEHAGWYLTYLFNDADLPDGTVVNSANDMAHWPEDVLEYWRKEKAKYEAYKLAREVAFQKRLAAAG
jgi:hypothetical protein